MEIAIKNTIDAIKQLYSKTYTRVPFPEYQKYMKIYEKEWSEEVVAIGAEDVLLPTKWILEQGG